MNKRDVDKWIVAIVSAFWGMLVFLYVFGYRVLDVTYDDWILTGYSDLIQHYMGWVAFRVTPWKFPIGLIDGISYPESISVIYTDSIPLFAVIFKVLSPILPDTFQYMGIWGLMCYALQGLFGGLIIYKFTGNKWYSIISSILFSGSSVMMRRMFYHTALAAHWLVLACLYFWFEHDCEEKMIRAIARWGILSCLALTIEAYFLPMVWGIMLCSLLQEIIEAKKVNKAIFVLFSSAISTIAVGYVFGLFYGDVPSSGANLGLYSFNLNGLINSQGMSSFLPGLYTAFGQDEGYSYLGIGVIALVVICVIHATCVHSFTSLEKSLSKIVPLLLFFVCFTCFAISPTVTLGEKRYVMDIPKWLYNLWSTFRSTGRMIWPVYYMIFIAVLAYLGRLFEKKNLAMSILMMACIVQFADLKGAIIQLHNNYNRRVEFHNSLQSDAWEEISDSYKHIMIYPDTFKMYSNVKGEHLWIYAQKNGLTMNVVYLARDITKNVNEYVYGCFDDLASFEEFSDTIYVFIDELPDSDKGLHYYNIDDLIIGTPQMLKTVEEISFEDVVRMRSESEE